MEWMTLNSLTLGNQLSVNFAIDWSNDGRLFILSDVCVYVMNLTPKMADIENVLSFTRSEINLCKYYAANHTGIDYDEIFMNLSQQTLYEHALNFNATPVNKYSNPPNITPVAAAWSPTLGDQIYKSQALLAVVSNTGNLEIFVQNLFKWSIVINITEKWVEYLKNDWEKEKLTNDYDNIAKVHLKRVNSSLITCFVWSDICSENNQYFMYIVAGHLNGYVSLWKLNYFNMDSEIIKTELVHSFKTDLDNITSIQIHLFDQKMAWIIIGTLSGIVQSEIINFDNNEIKSIDIWNHQDVRVSKIVSIGFDNNIGIIALKGPFIVFVVLSKSGVVVSSSNLTVGGLNITGIHLISPGTYVITTTTGLIKTLKIIKTPKGYEIKVNPISSDLRWDYHACHGITRSPSKILWSVLIHPCKVTDHLSLRSPIQLVFCTAKDFDPGSYLKNNTTMQLLNSWECLEILRCQSAKNNILPCSWLAKIDKFDDLSLYEIRIFYWISLTCEAFILKRSRCRKLKSTLPNRYDLKNILYFKYRIERINLIFDKVHEGKELREFDYNSLYLLYDGIRSFQIDEIYSKYFERQTDELVDDIMKKYDTVLIEHIPKCLWCEENLTSKPCTANHPDQRCCISGVQISGIAKWECGKCGLPAHELNEDSEIFCPFCDVPMIKMT